MSIPCPKCGAQIDVRLSLATPRPPENPTTGGDVGQLLEEIGDRTLNDWEADFISKLRERYEQYGEGVRLSEKQRNTLENIARGK